ncbi:MAG: NUDIX hydrolase [Clostridiaceae bacterium]|nr:NUDIX hydrolase [Clostridiaceae bacterium]
MSQEPDKNSWKRIPDVRAPRVLPEEANKGADRKKLPHCAAEPLLSEEVLGVDPRFIGRIFSVEVQKVQLPDGRHTTREVVRHPGGSCVVALDEAGSIYLVHQYRVGTGGPSREIPAGKLDPPEDALTCARRELAEETGLTADRWDLLIRFYPSPGYTDEVIHIYLARELMKGPASPDEGEFISCERIRLETALDEIRDGILTDGKTCLGILLTALATGLLR